MGLDMYLHRREIGSDGLPEPEICYWRKANQIRQWIVNHTGYNEKADVVIHVLTKEQIEALISDCQKVLENHSLAPQIMPTSSGFFFGNSDYDEYYFSVLERTVDELNSILLDTNFDTHEIVYYEWW